MDDTSQQSQSQQYSIRQIIGKDTDSIEQAIVTGDGGVPEKGDLSSVSSELVLCVKKRLVDEAPITVKRLEDISSTIITQSMELSNDDNNMDWFSEIAHILMNEVVTSFDPELQESLVRTLEKSCGAMSILQACFRILNDHKEKKSKRAHGFSKDKASVEFHPHVLEITFRMLRRILLFHSSTNHRREEPILLCGWMTMANQHKRAKNIMSSSLLHTHAEMLVFNIQSLPARIANVCHEHQIVLPSWATRSKFLSKWVQGSFTIVLAQQQTKNDPVVLTKDDASDNICRRHGKDNMGGTGTAATCVVYLHALVRRLMMCGSYDEIATGIILSFGNVDRDAFSYESQWGRLETVFPSKLFTVRTASRLLQSLVINHIMGHTDADLRPKDDTIQLGEQSPSMSGDFTIQCCSHILNQSKDIQDVFVRQVMFVTNPVQSVMKELSRVVALLLDRCPTPKAAFADDQDRQGCAGKVSHDSDEDDSNSDDDESLHRHNEISEKQPDTALKRAVRLVAMEWSQPSFLQSTEQSRQKLVTFFLIEGMMTIMRRTASTSEKRLPSIDLADPLATIILKGVSCRLESTLPYVRRDGMLVGECFGKLIDHPLHFEELEELRGDSEDDALELPQEENRVLNRVPKDSFETDAKKPKRRARRIDPTAPYESESEDDDTDTHPGSNNPDDNDGIDSVWSEQEELIPYLVEDDEEDLRQVPKPYFLDDCLLLLSVTEDQDKAGLQVEAALQELARLVRQRPPDLPDLAVPLTKRLLNLKDDAFHVENFVQLRRDALLALASVESTSVSDHLLKDFFAGDWTLISRLEILDVLEVTAKELSGWARSTHSIGHRGESTSPHTINNQLCQPIGDPRLTRAKREDYKAGLKLNGQHYKTILQA